MDLIEAAETIVNEIARSDDTSRHYCQTGSDDPEMPSVQLQNHLLNTMTEIASDPFEGYGVFRCPVCHDWWGHWYSRSVGWDISDWFRFGPDEPVLPHY